MPSRVSVKLNTNQLNRALKNAQKRVERVAVATIESQMDEQIMATNEAFQKAEYDGSTEDIEVYANKLGPRTWQLVAEGAAVAFIEYGTGVGANPGYINPTTGREFWFFTAKGRTIKLNAGGAPARKIYYRTTRDKYDVKAMIKNSLGDIKRLNLEDPDTKRRIIERDGKKYYREGGKPFLNPRTHELEYMGSKEVPVKVMKSFVGVTKGVRDKVDNGPREGAYITRGNPPNYIMRNASKKMTADIYQQFKAKFK